MNRDMEDSVWSPQQGDLRQGDLQLGLFGSGVAAEDVENNRVPVEDLHTPGFLKLSLMLDTETHGVSKTRLATQPRKFDAVSPQTGGTGGPRSQTQR